MSINKLTDADFQWHADQPDVPGKSAAEMKAFFDAPSKTLLEKVNEIIDRLYGEGEDNGELSGALADILSLLDRMDTAETNQQTLSETVESNKRNLTTMIANVDKSAKEIFDDVEILKTDKQNRLIAGKNITIEGDLISADVGAADQTYDAASENAQSGKAVAEALETKQDALTAGDNITIENGVISASGGSGGNARNTFSGTQFGTSAAISDLSGIAPNHVNITLSLQAQCDGLETDTSLNGSFGTFVNAWTYDITSTKKVVNMDCFATGNDVYIVSVLLYDDNGGLPEDAYESFVKQDFFISLSNLQNMTFSCSDANTGESVSLNLEYSGYYEL